MFISNLNTLILDVIPLDVIPETLLDVIRAPNLSNIEFSFTNRALE